MTRFEDTEIETIKEVLQAYINKNKKIIDASSVVDVLKNYTDFEQNQYKSITHIIDEYIDENEKISTQKDIDNIIEEIVDEVEYEDDKVFTKTNIIVSIISVLPALLTAHPGIIIYTIYALVFAYISKYIGIKKGIVSGYVWGYFLGIIGVFVVSVLPAENVAKEKIDNNEYSENSTNKYEDLEKLYKLKENGVLTEEEFNIEKTKIIKIRRYQ